MRVTRSNAELVCHFESLGRGCEFGFLQRLAGAEPMGLLRFAGLQLGGLVRGLRARFAGIADPDNMRLSLDGTEYRVEVVNFDFRYHTELFEGDIAPEQLHRLECRKLRFLAHQLIEELEDRTKIFVYQQREPSLAQDLMKLLSALSAYGGATLLWVVEADAANGPWPRRAVQTGSHGYTSRVRSSGVKLFFTAGSQCSASFSGVQPSRRAMMRIGRGWL